MGVLLYFQCQSTRGLSTVPSLLFQQHCLLELSCVVQCMQSSACLCTWTFLLIQCGICGTDLDCLTGLQASPKFDFTYQISIWAWGKLLFSSCYLAIRHAAKSLQPWPGLAQPLAFLGSAAFSGFPSIPGMLPGYPCLLNVQYLSCPLNVNSLFSTLSLTLHTGPAMFSSVQQLSQVQLFVTPCIAACQASLSITNSRSLLKLLSIEPVMQSNHLILCYPLLLPPSMFPSIRVFSNESVLCIWWPKYWSSSFSISPSNEYSGLISFRMDWLDSFAVQGTLRVFSNTTVQKHQFFSAQLSLQSNSHIHT